MKDMAIPIPKLHHWELLTLLIPVACIYFLPSWGYRAVLRYVGFKVLWTVSFRHIFISLMFGNISFFFEIFAKNGFSDLFAFAILLIGGVRLFFQNAGKPW